MQRPRSVIFAKDIVQPYQAHTTQTTNTPMIQPPRKPNLSIVPPEQIGNTNTMVSNVQRTTEVFPANSSVTSIDFAGNLSQASDALGGDETEKSNASVETGSTHHDMESQSNTLPPQREQECSVTVLTDLDCYKGDTLGEKVDSLIKAHPVVMFNKTWCLFSVDAQQFLLHQMKVSIHSVEVDVHPQGKAILKHVQETTGHDTVPVIYIRGAFLGGFEDVNQLYATGRLQGEYLKGLTQADRCEEFIAKTNIGIEPLFWFPSTVNAHVIRITGIMICLFGALSAVSAYWFEWGHYIAYILFLDFVLRLFAGSRLSLLGRIAMLLTQPLEPKPRHGRPKQFATMCGVMFSGLGSLFYLLNINYAGMTFMGALTVASGMEGFADYCLGCVMFKYGIKLGLIPK